MKHLLLALSISLPAFASTPEQIVGSYRPQKLRGVSVRCQKKAIETVKLLAQKKERCDGEIFLKNVTLVYDSGFKQIFEYPNDPAMRSPLSEATFRVLPGTKCLTGVSAEVDLAPATTPSCKSAQKIRLSVRRS